MTRLRTVPSSTLALSLVGVLLLAKTLILAGAGVIVGPVSFAAGIWQDLACVLAVGVIDIALHRPRWLWLVYACAVPFIAVGVPVTRVLGSPLTWPMISAAGGPLADSIAYYARPVHVAAMLAVLVCGVLLPRLLRRAARIHASAVMAIAAVATAGAVSVPHVELRGLDRNAITALMPPVKLSVSAAAALPPAWRHGDAAAPSPSLAKLRAAARGMNVVLVILESTAAQYLRTYGAADNPMPTLDALAQRAVVFDAAYAVYPESVKGLYATLCAQSPGFNLSMERFLARPRNQRAPCAAPAAAMSRAGYATALFHSGRFGYLGMDALVAEQGFDHLEDAGAISGRVQSSFGVDEASTVAHTLSWIDTVKPSPFLAVYMPAAGHHPYTSNIAPVFGGDDELSHYKNALRESDEALKSLIDGLRTRGILDRTAFIVTGDHGEAFGQHPGNAGHTLFIHDENVRVPFLIAVPGIESTRVSRPASVLDIAPTLLDLVGLAVPADVEGRSLLDVDASIAPFFADYSLGWLGLRDGCWKYQLDVSVPRSYLFDVCGDPGETHNVAAQHGERTARYRQLLTLWKYP